MTLTQINFQRFIFSQETSLIIGNESRFVFLVCLQRNEKYMVVILHLFLKKMATKKQLDFLINAILKFVFIQLFKGLIVPVKHNKVKRCTDYQIQT